jgi:hypothetical protein
VSAAVTLIVVILCPVLPDRELTGKPAIEDEDSEIAAAEMEAKSMRSTTFMTYFRRSGSRLDL